MPFLFLNYSNYFAFTISIFVISIANNILFFSRFSNFHYIHNIEKYIFIYIFFLCNFNIYILLNYIIKTIPCNIITTVVVVKKKQNSKLYSIASLQLLKLSCVMFSIAFVNFIYWLNINTLKLNRMLPHQYNQLKKNI